MTKEIIIDGIDVSDCMYYEPKAIKMTCHEQAITKPCNTSPICYYKLLHKANKNCESLEQENEKLKKTLQEIKEIINTCLEFKTCEKCKFYKACNRDLEGCILTLIKKAED